MKTITSFLLVFIIALTLTACTPKVPADNNPSDQSSGDSMPDDQTLTVVPQDEIIYVADAAMYRGTIISIENGSDGNTIGLEQAKGTDFGVPSLSFLFTADTKTSFEEGKLMEGDFLEVYYDGVPGEVLDRDQVQTAIGANLYPTAEMVIFNGTLKEIRATEGKDGAGQLIMEDLENGEEVTFNYDNEHTQFYLTIDGLKVNELLNIFHRGFYTASIPPQGSALEVRPFASSYVQTETLEDIENDTVGASSLLSNINDARKEVSNIALTRDSGLDQVAYIYAIKLFEAGSDFRQNTDFKTLPNGETVFSLFADNGIRNISSFYYSVWFNYSNLELTDEYITQAVNGDYENIGIARCTDSSGFNIVVLMFSK